VIVTLAAWLYIIQALLGLGSLFPGPFGLGGGRGILATLLVSALFGAMGIGLLRREAWGRWLALGVSLMSWTLGSLMLIGMLAAVVASRAGAMFFGALSSGGWMAIVAVIVVIAFLIMVVSVVISFKLFFHLCSRDGCEEFGVQYGSAGTVVASVGAWIGILIAQAFMASGGGGGLAMLLAQSAMSRGGHDRQEQDPEQLHIENERREYQRQYEERQHRAEQQARLSAIRENQDPQTMDAQAPDSGTSVDAPPAPATVVEPARVEEARAPTITAEVEDEKPDPSRILKCRDASGAVTFTQGYCPPGTQRVDMPKNE
jgi:hypothetical protein